MTGGLGQGWHEQPGFHVVARAMQRAGAAGTQARPVHLVEALAEHDSGIGRALMPVRSASGAPAGSHGGVSSYLLRQAQQAAVQLAATRAEPVDAPHLLIAVLDQGDAEALGLLARAGVDPAALRRVGLVELGAAADLAPITMPPLAPAGTEGRPALSVTELDARAWRVLSWRQQHLPLRRVRSMAQAEALSALERRAAWRVADRLDLDDDQRYSLLSRHGQVVDQAIERAWPSYARRRDTWQRHGALRLARLRRRWRWLPGFMVGWPTWFANRRAGIRLRWLALSTHTAYRGQPRP